MPRNPESIRTTGELEGQSVLVTGAAQGIGKAIAIRFAQEGADVAIVDINREKATKTSEEILRLGRRCTVHEADVSDHLAVEPAVNDVASKLGKIDVLVNNAGIEKREAFLEISPEDWRRHMVEKYCRRKSASAPQEDQ